MQSKASKNRGLALLVSVAVGAICMLVGGCGTTPKQEARHEKPAAQK
jgi:hypothetical protein